MRFLTLILASLAMLSVQAKADTNTNSLNVSFGASVPKDSNVQTYSETDGPSRSGGGEHFVLKFGNPKTVTDIKITGFSTGGAGKSLIRSSLGLNGSKSVAIPELTQYAKASKDGNAQNYQGLVMLPNGAFVEAAPNQAFSQLDIVIEGFSNDDASFLLQVTTADGLAEDQFMLTRTGPHKDETVGTLIDESGYAKFTPAQLAQMMTKAQQPQASDLVGKTFICSSYSKLNPTDVDTKTRSYFAAADGSILSSSDLEGDNIPWSLAADGLSMTIQNQNGCGNFVTADIVRKTPSGNLISEIDVDLQSYLALCEAAGYDPAGTQAVEANSTFPSVLNPDLAVDSYEFCRQSN